MYCPLYEKVTEYFHGGYVMSLVAYTDTSDTHVQWGLAGTFEIK